MITVDHPSRARLLLADDHAVVRAGLANALQSLTEIQIVGEVGDGPTLHAALDALHPDCLLVDVTMPAFEPLRDIGQIRHRYPSLKILVVSAHDDDAYVQGLLGLGVHGYHLKDQPLSDLRLAVERVLAGQRWICSPLVEKLLRAREESSSDHHLTPRQRDLLGYLRRGLDNQAIARESGLSIKTVENHLTRLYRQIGVQSRLEAANYIARNPHILGQAAALKPQAAPPAPSAAPYSAERTVLIVDDSLRYRSQVRRMIARSHPDLALVEAENIAAAAALTRRAAPLLALVDVVLADESGIECARQLRALAPELRIVILSAYPDREFHRRATAVGAVAFLDKKDLDAASLRMMIDDALS